RRHRVRRLLLLAATIVTALTLFACSSEEDKGSTENTTNSTKEAEATTAATEEPEETDAPEQTEAPSSVAAVPGAQAESNHIRIYFNGMKDPWVPDNQFGQPQAGKRFVSFDVTIEYFNDSDTHGANPFNFGLSDTQDYSYDPGVAVIDPEPRLQAVDLRPGQKTRGWVSFEVGADSALKVLRYQPNFLKDDYVEFNF